MELKFGMNIFFSLLCAFCAAIISIGYSVFFELGCIGSNNVRPMLCSKPSAWEQPPTLPISTILRITVLTRIFSPRLNLWNVKLRGTWGDVFKSTRSKFQSHNTLLVILYITVNCSFSRWSSTTQRRRIVRCRTDNDSNW